MDETVRENLSKHIDKAATFIAMNVIALILILPLIFGVTSPIIKLFLEFPDARAALIGFILGSCAFAALTPLFAIQFANLLPKLEMTWSFVIRFTALVFLLVSYALTGVFIFHSRDALEEFRYPIFGESTLYLIVYVYAIATGCITGFVYEPAVKAVSKIREYVRRKKSERSTSG
jgi:hypothetical protein